MCVTKGYGKAVKGPLGTTGQHQENTGGHLKAVVVRSKQLQGGRAARK